MKLLRYGTLSATTFKNYDKEIFHAPPFRKGIFAFPFEYEEPFLWTWKVSYEFKKGYEYTEEEWKEKFQQLHRERKVFEYDGPFWCHFTRHIDGETIRSWVITDSNGWEKALRKVKHEDMKGSRKSGFGIPIDPYKRGLGGIYSRDHLEVFIQKRHLGKIR